MMLMEEIVDVCLTFAIPLGRKSRVLNAQHSKPKSTAATRSQGGTREVQSIRALATYLCDFDFHDAWSLAYSILNISRAAWSLHSGSLLALICLLVADLSRAV